MSVKFKELVAAQSLLAAPASVYTAPELTGSSIQQATVYNPTGAAVTFTLYKSKVPVTADVTTVICRRVVPAGKCVQANEAINHKLEAGTTLLASGLSLTLNISGVEYVPTT